MDSLVFIYFMQLYYYIRYLCFSKELTSLEIDYFFLQNKKHFNLSYFIEKQIPITAEAFSYFFEYDRINLFANYQKLVPNNSEIQYHTLLPIHSNGISKKLINYRDLFIFDNININHFSSFLKNGDKHVNDKNFFLIHSKNNRTEIGKFRKNKFTLIYLITISKATPQIIYEIKALSHPEVAFIIFIDNKSDRKEHYKLYEREINNKQFENVYFVDSPRFVISWAHITQAFSQIAMNQAALKYFPDSLYLSHHSESEYPIVPNEFIIKFLKEHYPNNYMITFKDLKRKSYRKNTFRLIINHHVNDYLMKVIWKLFPKKVIPAAEWRCGWNWFTMTLVDSKKMMNAMFDRFEIVDCLDYVQYADEIIFSTLAAQANVTIMYDYLRFIDWTGCNAHPLVLNENNFKDYNQAKLFFLGQKIQFN